MKGKKIVQTKPKRAAKEITVPDTDLMKYDLAQTEFDHLIKYELSTVSPRLSKWAAEKRPKLQCLANKYEIEFANFLLYRHITFVHQMPIGALDRVYFIDFYFPQANIAIEIDGKSHDNEEQVKKDRQRDQDLHDMGIKVIRIKNEAVYNGINILMMLIHNGLYTTKKNKLSIDK